MPEYLHPGVYVEETSFRAKSIEGVSTSTAAFLGEAARGPVRPVLVTSINEYQRWFGGAAGANTYLPDAVRGFFTNGGDRLYVCRVASLSATYAQAACGPYFTLRAAGPGAWGSRVFAFIQDSSKQVIAAGVATPIGFRLRLAYYNAEPVGDPRDWFDGAAGAPEPEHFEDFDNLVVDETSPDWWQSRLRSSALAMLFGSTGAPTGARPDQGFKRLSEGGSDGATPVDSVDFQGNPASPPDEAQGLAALALDQYRDISLVYAAGVPFNVAQLIVRHCEDLRFRFAIVDSEPSTLPSDFDPQAAVANSKFAAFYYPWIFVADPASAQQRRAVPPGGHVAGVYARTDRERGVHKAPANELVRGAIGVVAGVRDAEQGTFNEHNINVIRDFPGRGIRIWGARTLSSDSAWRYVSVQRLFIFLERSIDEGTQWATFEPNNEATWARFSDTVQQFLFACWRSGALQGMKPAEAFFVRCDRTTMSADDILNGRLICEVGIAPTRPAEFVIFRIFQKTL
jgi:phage tail sheath protein FI